MAVPLLSLAAVPATILLGLFADLAAGITGPGGPRRPWRRPWTALRAFGRAARPADPPERAGTLAAAGAFAAMAGSGLTGAAVLGEIPGTLPAVYLYLLVAAAGAHLAAADARSPSLMAEADRDRLPAAVFEVAFLVALLDAFLRWSALDLASVRGAQAVLGPGLSVGPAGRAAGLAIAALVLAVASAGRLGPVRATEPAVTALASLARWSAVGAGAAVTAALVLGPDVPVGAGRLEAILQWAGGTAGAALVAGLAGGLIERVPARGWRAAAGAVALLGAGGAAVLVRS